MLAVGNMRVCRNKIIMFLPSLITTSVLQLFVIASAYFMWVLMNESGCTTIQNRVLLPFIGTILITSSAYLGV